MKVGNREVRASGSIVIPAGQSATISFSGVTLPIAFKNSGGSLAFGLEGGTLVFENFNNPLGDAATFDLDASGHTLHFGFYIFTAPSGIRLVNYTVS